MGDRRRTTGTKTSHRHAEGEHGPRTHARLIEQLESGRERNTGPSQPKKNREGKHRLQEDREQHDPADRNSDMNRLDREIREKDLDRDRYEVRGRSRPHGNQAS